MLKRSALDQPEKRNIMKRDRFLISIKVHGSTGPIRFVVNEDDLVCEVIKTALKSYARQARLPVLGSDADHFILYCVNAEADALSPRERIGSKQVRNFVLWKKQGSSQPVSDEKISKQVEAAKSRNRWKSWLLNKPLSFMIQSH